MKDYILIVFGDFNSERKVYDVMLGITPVVESENLKFHYNELSIVCHFESQESQQEISDFIHAVLQDSVSMFFISEIQNLSFQMNEQMKKHLLNLEETNDVNMAIDMEKIRRGEDGLLEQDLINIPIVFNDDDEDEDEIKEIKNRKKSPSLDEILEKIHIYGYESLSQNEIKLLNTYSN